MSDGNHFKCPFEDRIYNMENKMNNLHETAEKVLNGIGQLTSNISRLESLQEKFTRWLLAVVCVIALGKGMLDIAKDFILKDAKATYKPPPFPSSSL